MNFRKVLPFKTLCYAAVSMSFVKQWFIEVLEVFLHYLDAFPELFF